jgi:hypothetical protein
MYTDIAVVVANAHMVSSITIGACISFVWGQHLSFRTIQLLGQIEVGVLHLDQIDTELLVDASTGAWWCLWDSMAKLARSFSCVTTDFSSMRSM